MSQRLIQPGLAALTHPRTGNRIVPLGYRRDGSAIWPVLGASPDDDSDTDPTPPDDDDDDDSDDDDSDDDDSEDDDEDDPKDKKNKGKGKKKPKHAKDDDEDEDDEAVYTESEMKAVRDRMKAADRRSSDLEARLKKLENKGKKPEEIASDEKREADARAKRNADHARGLALENAFLKVNTVKWEDADDALAVAQRLGLLEDVQDDDGKVDRKALGRALKQLARRKPHLVKKARGHDEDDADDKNDGQGPDETPPPRMNGKRKGRKETTDRAELARTFPALNRI